MMITCAGRRFPAVKIIRATRLNRQLNRVTANATIEATNRVTMTAGTAMISEFR
jgi:hypothetical protein